VSTQSEIKYNQKQSLHDRIVLSLGDQLVDWSDDIASTTITANELGIDEELVTAFVQNNLGGYFRDFDGIDNPIFSIEGWDYYQALKDKHIGKEVQ